MLTKRTSIVESLKAGREHVEDLGARQRLVGLQPLRRVHLELCARVVGEQLAERLRIARRGGVEEVLNDAAHRLLLGRRVGERADVLDREDGDRDADEQQHERRSAGEACRSSTQPIRNNVARPLFLRIGHKGADAITPGNTLESFAAAVEAGVDAIEFDVLRPALGLSRRRRLARRSGRPGAGRRAAADRPRLGRRRAARAADPRRGPRRLHAAAARPRALQPRPQGRWARGRGRRGAARARADRPRDDLDDGGRQRRLPARRRA